MLPAWLVHNVLMLWVHNVFCNEVFHCFQFLFYRPYFSELLWVFPGEPVEDYCSSSVSQISFLLSFVVVVCYWHLWLRHSSLCIKTLLILLCDVSAPCMWDIVDSSVWRFCTLYVRHCWLFCVMFLHPGCETLLALLCDVFAPCMWDVVGSSASVFREILWYEPPAVQRGTGNLQEIHCKDGSRSSIPPSCWGAWLGFKMYCRSNL